MAKRLFETFLPAVINSATPKTKPSRKVRSNQAQIWKIETDYPKTQKIRRQLLRSRKDQFSPLEKVHHFDLGHSQSCVRHTHAVLRGAARWRHGHHLWVDCSALCGREGKTQCGWCEQPCSAAEATISRVVNRHSRYQSQSFAESDVYLTAHSLKHAAMASIVLS